MGIPSFFRWLVKRYPNILSKVVSDYNNVESTEEQEIVNGHFDNLYLDLNGVIHSCSHADTEELEDHLSGLSDNERFGMISRYIDHLVNLVRPKSLLYLAIDGVAPRAKMNQQRSRRFKSADVAMTAEKSGKSGRWDSNQITPGTPFMTALTTYLENDFQQRVNTNPLYKNLKILFSPCCSPGEGEHKIIAFIRAQRRDVDYNPNLTHCVYGGDADLILLGLGTHEPRFHILREALPPPGMKSNRTPSSDEKVKKYEEFEMVNLGVLRAYLARDLVPESAKLNDSNIAASLRPLQDEKGLAIFSPPPTPVSETPSTPRLDAASLSPHPSSTISTPRPSLQNPTPVAPVLTELDFERVIDDWIVMSFFVGNDFIPSLPSLKIREGAISVLAKKYRDQVLAKGYIVAEDRSVDLARVREIIADVAKNEALAFQKRKVDDDYFKKHVAPRLDREQGIAPREEDSLVDDEVRFHEPGYRERYYMVKMGIDVNSAEGAAKLQEMLEAYQAGLLWIAEYYFHGCRSWLWYYPFHYAPLASDLATLALKPTYCPTVRCWSYQFCSKHQFVLGTPFCPFAQLLAVLPPLSVKFLPKSLWPLVLDPSSPLASYYPTKLDIDCEDPRLSWQAVVRLPFVDEKILLATLEPCLALLDENERARNENWNFGQDIILVNDSHVISQALRQGIISLTWKEHGLSADVVVTPNTISSISSSSCNDTCTASLFSNDNVTSSSSSSLSSSLQAGNSEPKKWRINAQRGYAREILGEHGPRCPAVLLPSTSFAEYVVPKDERKQQNRYNNNNNIRSYNRKDHNYSPEEIIFHTMKQLEGYFSQSNLQRDIFLQTSLRQNNGWVPLTVVAEFPRMKYLNGGDVSICLRAALDSNLVTVNPERTCVQPKVGGEETGLRDLSPYFGKCQCLNEESAYPLSNAFNNDDNSVLKSSSDEQLLITVPFLQPVDIASIELKSVIDGSAPASIRVFLNSPHLDFNDAEEETVSPVQSFLLSQEHYTDAQVTLQPLHGRFTNVSCITLFVASNVGLKDVTIIASLRFKGQLHAQGMPGNVK